MKATIALLGALLLSGCQSSGPETGENDPKYPWWELVFVQPNYMKVWVEDSSVQDINNRVFLELARALQPAESPISARNLLVVGEPCRGAGDL